MARMLERENDETKDEGYYLNDSGFDRDIDKERILIRWSRVKKKDSGNRWNGKDLSTYTSRFTPDTTTKSQRIYDKPAQSRLPRRCLFFRPRV